MNKLIENLQRLHRATGAPSYKEASDRLIELEATCRDTFNELMNLQPHIEGCCYPKMRGFIDDHVDVAMENLRTVVPDVMEVGEDE